MHVTVEMPFSLPKSIEIIPYGYVRKCVKLLTFLLDNIYIRLDTKFFRQIVGIPRGTKCTPLVADFFLVFRYEKDSMMGRFINY